MRILLSLGLTATFLLSSVSAQVDAYHGKTGNEHQTLSDDLSAKGYRPISLSIYGSTGSLRYAAIWIQRAGPLLVGFHGFDSDDYQDFVNTRWPQGYRPICLTATGSGGNARFAGFFELTNAPGDAQHGLTEAEFVSARTAARALDQDITAIDIYNTVADPRYIVAFGPVAAGQGSYVSIDKNDYQEHFDAFAEGHARPKIIAFNDHDRYVSVWQSDDIGDWIGHHDMTSKEYQDYTDLYSQANWYPITVQGSGSGSDTRYAAAWAASDLPLANQWTMTGPGQPSMQPFDDWVQNWMTSNDLRGASLAVVKDGRLVHARGYTWARKGYPVTQPTSLFAIASCSKPITSIAIHQAFDGSNNLLDPSDSMMGLFPGTTVFDGNTSLIDIHALLTHQAGWDSSLGIEPMLAADATIASALGIPLPIDKYDIFDFMLESQPLDYLPYSNFVYSNFGFSVLGRVLEQSNTGIPYASVVQQKLFDPLGITRAEIGGSLFSELLPGEVLYHQYRPSIARSAMEDARPWVASQYGAWNERNLDAHGGWVMAAPDFAKVLAAFDLGARNPILGLKQTTAMWTDDPSWPGVMRGWFRKSVADGNGGTVNMAHHNGGLGGTTSFVAHRLDGYSFVFLTNGNRSLLFGNVQGEELSDIANTIPIWPNHDLFPDMGLPSLMDYRAGNLTRLGGGCRGPLGEVGIDVAGTWDPGQAMSFDLDNAQPLQAAVVFVGLQPAAIALDPIGMPSCSLLVQPLRNLVGITDAGGKLTLPWIVPDLPELIGLPVYAQGAAVDPTANVLGLTSTDALKIVLGGWN